MEPHDTFEGSPWGAEPTADWNDPAYWASQYRELLAEADSWARDQTIDGDVSLLVWMLAEAGELPLSSPHLLITVAGDRLTGAIRVWVCGKPIWIAG